MNLDKLVGVNNFVVKNWGWEIWVANNPLYCGKILYVKKGKKFSFHYHILKDETFFCLEGLADLYYSENDCLKDGKFDISQANHLVFRPGVAFHIKPGLRHQVIASEDTYLMETSSEHFDSDSYRIEKGD